jgi:ParB-like chromosome segregation protein Spo0J
MNENQPVDRRQLPITSLTPCRHRKASQEQQEGVLPGLQAEGLSHSLVVYDRGSSYEILDGHSRFGILRELGVTTIPCLVLKEEPNRD